MGLKWKNEYFDNGECIVLRLSREDPEESWDALIDYCDYDKVKLGQWFVYVYRKDTNRKNIIHILWTKTINGKKYNFDIYQYILNTKDECIIVDHKNRNRLDNRRNNLRFVTHRENSLNQDRGDILGYRYEKKHNKYLTRITVNGVMINIGRYKTEEEANNIYLKCCIAVGLDEVPSTKERIDKYNVVLNEEDLNNKYIQKVILVSKGEEIPKNLNGRYKLDYYKHMRLVNDMINKGFSYHYISKYIVKNNLMGSCKSDTLKKYHKKYIDNN